MHPSAHAGMCTAPGCPCTDFRPAVGQFARPTAAAPAPRPASPRVAPTRTVPQPVARIVQPEPSDREVFSGQRGPTIEQILQAGKRSSSKRTVALTEKIAVQINDLRGRLHDEREASEEARKAEAARTEAKSKIAELEKQLAEARKALRTGSAVSPGSTRSISGERIPCTETGCDQTFTREDNRTRHLSRAHGIGVSPEHHCPDCDKSFDTPQALGPHRRMAHGHKATA
jgi:uncharacterized C2H2 Zn-finger protein